MAQDRILDTAIREFGIHGLEGVGTRQIAHAAGTAMSAITYHYGGKEQLYHAAAEQIADDMANEFAAVLDAEEGIGPNDRVGAREALQRILGQFVEKMAIATMSDHSLFIVREQMSPTTAFDILYSGMVERLVDRLRDLIRIATGADKEEATYATISLLGQALVMRSARATALRMFDCQTIDTQRIAQFRRQVAFNTEAILDRMAEQQGHGS